MIDGEDEVAKILAAFKEINQIYQEILEVSGATRKIVLDTRNSADFHISLDKISSSTNIWRLK